MYVRPFTCAIKCAALGLLLVQCRGRSRRWRESNTPTPTTAPLARARGRKPNVYFRMGHAERHVGGVGAREAATEKPNAGAHEKQERGALRVRVARACDEEDFRDRVTGEGMGCGREDNLVLGSPGRGGFGKWGRLFGDVSVRRQMVSGWVSWRDPEHSSHAPATTPRQRIAETQNYSLDLSPLPSSLSPSATLSEAPTRDTRRATRGLA